MVSVVEQQESDGQTAADYDSRSLMDLCKSCQLLLGTYELLYRLNTSSAAAADTQSPTSTPANEPRIKAVRHVFL